MNVEPSPPERARVLVAQVIPDDVSDVGVDEDLRDYGLDSIRLVELITTLKHEGADVEFADLVGEPTLQAIAHQLRHCGKDNAR